jgi:hypothetical protein
VDFPGLKIKTWGTQSEKYSSGIKPHYFGSLYGTTEVVPFQSRMMVDWEPVGKRGRGGIDYP